MNKTNEKGQGTLFFLILLLFIVSLSICRAQQEAAHTVFTTDYLVNLPNAYEEQGDRKWPLMIFLHSADMTPRTIEELKQTELVKGSNGLEQTFMVISPILQRNQWNIGTLNLLLDEVIQEYRVDPDKVYLVGHGVWDWVFTDPERFAALVVLSGCPKKRHWSDAWRLRNMPILIMGLEGKEKPCNQQMVGLIREHTGRVKIVQEMDGENLAGVDNPLQRWLVGKNRADNIPKLISPKEGLLRECVGRYTFDGETFTIALVNGRLVMTRGKGGSRGLVAESDTTFLFGNNLFAGLTFTRDADGRVNGFEILPKSNKKGIKID